MKIIWLYVPMRSLGYATTKYKVLECIVPILPKIY